MYVGGDMVDQSGQAEPLEELWAETWLMRVHSKAR